MLISDMTTLSKELEKRLTIVKVLVKFVVVKVQDHNGTINMLKRVISHISSSTNLMKINMKKPKPYNNTPIPRN
jgi:hypothetical protein